MNSTSIKLLLLVGLLILASGIFLFRMNNAVAVRKMELKQECYRQIAEVLISANAETKLLKYEFATAEEANQGLLDEFDSMRGNKSGSGASAVAREEAAAKDLADFIKNDSNYAVNDLYIASNKYLYSSDGVPPEKKPHIDSCYTASLLDDLRINNPSASDKAKRQQEILEENKKAQADALKNTMSKQ